MSNSSPNQGNPGPGRPEGAKNTKPRANDLRKYREELRIAADGGDIQAMAWLLLINAIENG